VTIEEVVTAVEERDVRFIRLWFTDILAILPYPPRERAVARMFCDIRLPGGEPYEVERYLPLL
jgi:glutamine synthetase